MVHIFYIHFSAISGIIDDIQKHFDIGPSQTSLLRTRFGVLRLIRVGPYSRAPSFQNQYENQFYQKSENHKKSYHNNYDCITVVWLYGRSL